MQHSAPGREFAYRISADNRIESVNPDWLSFARENSAPLLTTEAVVGRSLFRFLASTSVRYLYQLIIDRTRRSQRTIVIPFRCDGPSVRRFMELSISPCANGNVQFVGRMIREESRTTVSLLDASITRTNEYVAMCSWCKRVEVSGEWLEVEQALRQTRLFEVTSFPKLAHGVCTDCADRVQRKIAEAGL